MVKEIREESGFEARAVKLAALLDRRRHPHPTQFHHCYKLFFLCELTGGAAGASIETDGVDFFAEDQLPPLSTQRITPGQIQLMFRHERRGSAYHLRLRRRAGIERRRHSPQFNYPFRIAVACVRRSILFYLGILGLAHLYVGWRLPPDLPIGLGAQIAGASCWWRPSFRRRSASMPGIWNLACGAIGSPPPACSSWASSHPCSC